MTPVKGKDVIVWIQRDGVYILMVCAKASAMEFAMELIPTATADSTRDNTYVSGFRDCTVTLDSLTTINEISRYQFADFVRNRSELHTLKILFTTPNGDILQYEFEALIERISATNNVGQFAANSVALRVTGEMVETIVFDSYPYDDDDETVYSDYWNPTVNGTNVTISGTSARWSYSLVGKEFLQVRREGINYEIVSGTPTGRECNVNSAAGSVTFPADLPFSTGERVYVLFKES